MGDEEVPVLSVEELATKVNLVSHPVVAHKMTQLRRAETSSKHFRELLREITMYLGYQATQDLETTDLKVTTPIGEHPGAEISSKVCFVPVMRSGLGMLDPMLDIMPMAPVYHLGLYRSKKSLLPVLYYNKLPAKCEVDRAIILEPLVATAGTISAVVDILDTWGAKEIVVLAAITSRKGLSTLLANHPNVKVHTCAIDDSLTEDGYIVPGLGDSGERLNNTWVPGEEPIEPQVAEPAAKRQKK